MLPESREDVGDRWVLCVSVPGVAFHRDHRVGGVSPWTAPESLIGAQRRFTAKLGIK